VIDLPALFKEVAIDLAPGLLGTAIKEYLRQRAEEARLVLLDEVKKANIDAANAASKDDAIAVVFRFERAVREGTARLNLRLMAKAMAGSLHIGTLVADEFLLYADALATLSRDEIIVIAAILREHRRRRSLLQNENGDTWWRARIALEAEGWSSDRAGTAATRAQRSGFIRAFQVQDYPTFQPTVMLVDLGRTVDFEDALRAEGIR
jgi:hypothetical protein